VLSLTLPFSLMTFETVAFDTPARSATSRIVVRDPIGAGMFVFSVK
jgi:hypothetical protein